MLDIWKQYRHFDVRVGVCCTEIDEFKIGSHVEFNDLYENNKGSGVIQSFAQCGYEPTVWLINDTTGHLENVMLGWCNLI